MFGVSPLDIAVIILYLLGMIGIGYVSMRKIKIQEDFFLAGRGFGKIIQTFASFGSGTNADNAVTTARNVFTGGLSGIWTVLNYLFCTPFYWFIAVWMRRLRTITIADFFAERYESKKMAGVYAVFGLLFFMVYLSLGFSAVGKTVLAITPKSIAEMSQEERAEINRFQQWRELESRDYTMLSERERTALEQLRIESPRGNISHFDPTMVLMVIAVVVLIYGVSGGLQAAFISDLIQGVFIILLSIMLIPFGLLALSDRFGGQGILEGFTILHDRVPQEYFDIIGSATASDFTWYYLVAVVLLNLTGIGVQPHTMLAFGASAKDEQSARVGAVSGNLLKRFCTVMWCLVGLIAIALYADELADADQVWGYATQGLLGPVGFGLVGLMIACIFAAFMSSADAFMIGSSALVVRNLYQPVLPNRSEKHYVFIARCVSVFVIGGGVFFAIYYQDIFQQLKIAWEIPVIFAGSFYVGMFWRRATTAGAWTSVLVTAVLFFILPAVIPVWNSDMRTDLQYLTMTRTKEVRRIYYAREMDVQKRLDEIKAWKSLPEERRAGIAEPVPLHVGSEIAVTVKPAPISLYWTKGISADENGQRIGLGFFNYDLYLMRLFGLPLETYANPVIETLRLPLRLIIPFLLVLLVSIFTGKNSDDVLHRFYAKMKTPAGGSPEEDRQRVLAMTGDHETLRSLKLFPDSSWEFQKWTKEDGIGLVVVLIVVMIVIALAMAVSAIGA